MKLYKYLPFGSLLLILFVAGCCSKTEGVNCTQVIKNKTAYDASLHQTVDSSIANKYVYFAMMASNSYHKAGRVTFPLLTLGWQQVDLDGNPTNKPSFESSLTGVAYDVYKK